MAKQKTNFVEHKDSEHFDVIVIRAGKNLLAEYFHWMAAFTNIKDGITPDDNEIDRLKGQKYLKSLLDCLGFSDVKEARPSRYWSVILNAGGYSDTDKPQREHNAALGVDALIKNCANDRGQYFEYIPTSNIIPILEHALYWNGVINHLEKAGFKYSHPRPNPISGVCELLRVNMENKVLIDGLAAMWNEVVADPTKVDRYSFEEVALNIYGEIYKATNMSIVEGRGV